MKDATRFQPWHNLVPSGEFVAVWVAPGFSPRAHVRLPGTRCGCESNRRELQVLRESLGKRCGLPESTQCQLVVENRCETCCTSVTRLELMIRDEFAGTSERQVGSPWDVSPSEPPNPTESNELTIECAIRAKSSTTDARTCFEHVLRARSSTHVWKTGENCQVSFGSHSDSPPRSPSQARGR